VDPAAHEGTRAVGARRVALGVGGSRNEERGAEDQEARVHA
jgi:hypothetical protein